MARVLGWDTGQSSKGRTERVNKKQTNGHRVTASGETLGVLLAGGGGNSKTKDI